MTEPEVREYVVQNLVGKAQRLYPELLKVSEDLLVRQWRAMVERVGYEPVDGPVVEWGQWAKFTEDGLIEVPEEESDCRLLSVIGKIQPRRSNDE